MTETHDENEERRRQLDPVAACAHMRINYAPIDHGNSRYTSRWLCSDCKTEFVPGKLLDHMVRAAFPETITIRDRFAMAALAAAGEVIGGNYPGDAARMVYQWADAMLEARAESEAEEKKEVDAK